MRLNEGENQLLGKHGRRNPSVGGPDEAFSEVSGTASQSRLVLEILSDQIARSLAQAIDTCLSALCIKSQFAIERQPA